MSMLKKIIKTLNANEKIKDFKVLEVNTNTVEQFYDLQRLETTRKTNTLEDNVTIYIEKEINGVKKIGSSSFIVSHKISNSELNTLIDDAIYASSFINNEYYELVDCEGKKSFKQKKESLEPFELLQTIAKIFFGSSNDKCMFNALEAFYTEKDIHLVTSKGIDYKKNVHKVMIEAIPSFKSDEVKTELYRMFKYDEIDFDKIKKDATDSINDILSRAQAKQNTYNGKINVILKDDSIKSLFNELISTYDYSDVYRKSNYKEIGDMVQEKPVCPLTLSLKPSSKADFFDADGVLLKEVLIIQKGKLIENFGSNRFAYYLGKKANGVPSTIKVDKGNLTESKMKKEPYIEIVDLSGIQIELFSDYIGGEVRLAKYFDGKDTYPISGFSFTASLTKCVNNFELSKETTTIEGYTGPKYALLKDVEIM